YLRLRARRGIAAGLDRFARALPGVLQASEAGARQLPGALAEGRLSVAAALLPEMALADGRRLRAAHRGHGCRLAVSGARVHAGAGGRKRLYSRDLPPQQLSRR